MKTKKLVFAAMFVALGVILPQAFHLIGGQAAGSIFLPMHIPVLIGGILLGGGYGLLIGCLSVIIGFMLGMPPFPMALFMFFELATYGLVGGYLGYSKKINVYVTLILAMIAGRLASLAVINIAINLFGMQLSPVFGTIAMFAAGVPGMVVQIVIVPAAVILLKKLYIEKNTSVTA